MTLSARHAPIAFLLAGALFAAGCGPEDDGPQTGSSSWGSTAAVVDTEIVVAEPIEVTVRSVGTVRAIEEAELCVDVAGKVAKILFEEGSTVAESDLLLVVDEEKAQLSLNQARSRLQTLSVSVRRADAEVEQARAVLANAEATFKRKTTLFEKGAETRAVFLDVKAAFEAAQAAHAAAEAARAEIVAQQAEATDALALAEKTLRDHRLRAPFDGVLGERLLSVGDFVDVGEGVVTLSTTDPIHVEFTVPERYRGKVRPGQEVDVHVEALRDVAFRGEVVFIAPALDPSTRSVKVKALFENRVGALKPGFFCHVRLIVDRAEEAAVLSEEAILPRENAFFVYVVKERKAVLTEVKKGERLEGRVQIVGGVAPGDEVITAGIQKVSDGVPVRPRRSEPAGDAGREQAPEVEE